MDVLVELIRKLVEQLTPGTFLVVLALILGISALIVKFIFNHVKRPGGVWSFLDDTDEAVELVDVHNSVKELSENMTARLDKMSVVQDRVLLILERGVNEELARNNKLDEFATTLISLASRVEEYKRGIAAAIEKIDSGLIEQGADARQALDNFKIVMDSALIIVNRIENQLDQLESYAHETIPEFKAAHRDLSRELSILSRDIALVERSLQMQINNVSAVNLR
jgi:outer membrane murein-binding lipoprotein Lpp